MPQFGQFMVIGRRPIHENESFQDSNNAERSGKILISDFLSQLTSVKLDLMVRKDLVEMTHHQKAGVIKRAVWVKAKSLSPP